MPFPRLSSPGHECSCPIPGSPSPPRSGQLDTEQALVHMHECGLSHFSRVRLRAAPWTVACWAPLSMAEYWSGLPRPPPGDLPDPGTEPTSLKSLTLAVGFFTASATWEACSSPRLLPKGPPGKPALVHVSCQRVHLGSPLWSTSPAKGSSLLSLRPLATVTSCRWALLVGVGSG